MSVISKFVTSAGLLGVFLVAMAAQANAETFLAATDGASADNNTKIIANGHTLTTDTLANFATRGDLANFDVIWVSPGLSAASYTTLQALVATGGALDVYANGGGVLVLNVGGNQGNQLNVAPGGVDFVRVLEDAVTFVVGSHPYITGAGYAGFTLTESPDFELVGWNTTSHGVFTSLPASATTVITNQTDTRANFAEYAHGVGKVLATGMTYGWGTGGALLNPQANLINYAAYCSETVSIACPTTAPINVECGVEETISFAVADTAGEAITVTYTVNGVAVPSETTVVPAPASGQTLAVVNFDFTYTGTPGVTTFTVVATATNSPSGDVRTCTVTPTLVDTTDPVITSCPTVAATECTSAAGAIVNYPAATATDNCGTPTITYSQASGTTFPLGSTAVTVTATDAQGLTDTCSFNVVVQDTTPPTITSCPTVAATECTGPTGTVVNYPAATATDACGTPVITYSQNSGTAFPLGTTTVTVTATDAAGLTATCTFDVVVQDTTVPSAICPANQTVECTSSAGAIVNYPAATATDICDANPVITYSQATGTQFPLGTTTVTVNATDASGNVGMCTFDVNVVDTTPPVFNPDPPADPAPVECTGPTGTVVTFPDPSISDLCDPNPTVTCSPASGSAFPLGMTTVTCTATDSAGNSSMSSFTVTVIDTTPPAVTANAVRKYLLPLYSGLTPPGLSASAIDICDGPVAVTCEVWSDEPHGTAPLTPDATGTAATPGSIRVRSQRTLPGNGRVYLIIVRATDASGNTGFACTSVVIPAYMTMSSIMMVLNEAATAKTFVNGNAGLAPSGYFQLL